MKISKKELYIRQTTLPEIGKNGQERLEEAEIVIIGCGGLGSVAAVYLAASGIGGIHLVDYDVVEASNLHRQVYYKPEDIGKPKAEVLAAYIRSIAPFTEVTYSTERITKANAIHTIDQFAIALDCTDNLPTKYLINDVCVITDTILVYGSLYKYDGYVATFGMTKDNKRTANLRDAFPDMASQKTPNCSEIGTLNTIVGIIGIMQANEVIKIVTHTGEPLMNQILIYNSQDNSQYKMKLSSEPCYKKASRGCILKTFKRETYKEPDCEIPQKSHVLTLEEVQKNKNLEIISVTETEESGLPFKVSKQIPFSKFKPESIIWKNDREYLLVCMKGITSYTAAEMVREKYPEIRVYSLQNGIEFL